MPIQLGVRGVPNSPLGAVADSTGGTRSKAGPLGGPPHNDWVKGIYAKTGAEPCPISSNLLTHPVRGDGMVGCEGERVSNISTRLNLYR